MITQNNKFSRKKKLFLGVLFIIITIILVINIMNIIIEPESYIEPTYEKIDITDILKKNSLSEEDYKTLFYQTGLGKIAIDEILFNNDSGIEEIIIFQDDFFKKNNVICENIGIITNQESFVDKNGNYQYGFNLAPYKKGYVLITKATHSLGWRHGHAAIVTNAENAQTLEAIILGEDSQIQNINKWRVYPSFIMLKLKDTSLEELSKIADFSLENMTNIPYRLTIGLLSEKFPSPEKLNGTHCSHLVWYPYKYFGYDIDSDGSFLVTPKDIANSDLFDIVQIYGVSPESVWP